MWFYNETAEFVRCSEELELSNFVRDALKSWAKTVGRVVTNKTRLGYRSPRNKYELWIARVPDPDSSRGSSGGFRLVYFFNIPESSIHLDLMERRSDLGFKKEHPRDKQKFTNYINSLKEQLKKLDN